MLRVNWVSGYLKKTYANRAISLDDDNSFSIEIQNGQVAVSLDELAGFAQHAGVMSSGLTNLRFVSTEGQFVIEARYHHTFPIRVTGDVSAAPGDLVRIHIVKIELLGLPMKGLLHVFHIKPADLIDNKHTAGIRFEGDDMFIAASQLLPPPHINGDLKQVKLSGHDLIETFGNAGPEVMKREDWRNYLSLKGGEVVFGKLLMTNTDMIMIDTSADEWFDLDLDHYQAQMVFGYIRMTPQAGLQVFMPDLKVVARNMGARFNMDWMKNRNQAPPADVMPH